MSSPTQELLGGSLSTTGLYNKPISGINIKSVSTVTKNEVNMIKSDNICLFSSNYQALSM